MKCCLSKMVQAHTAWWVVLSLGILMLLCSFVYWLWPVVGYEIAAQLFGWMLIVAGVVYIVVGTTGKAFSGWGWWLVGGIIAVFCGFVIVGNFVLSLLILPYLMAAMFIYLTIFSAADAFAFSGKLRWIKFASAFLYLLMGLLFICAGYIQDMLMVSMLATLAFIYWGLTLITIAIDMKKQLNDAK